MDAPIDPSKIEKSPLSSKKFVAAMTWNLCWLILIGYGIHRSLSETVLLAMISASGGLQVIYIGGQAALDAVVRKALRPTSGLSAQTRSDLE